MSPVALLHLSLSQPEKAGVCVCLAQRVRFHFSDVTVDGAEARQRDPPLPPEVPLGPRVDALDQALLVQQGVVGSQRTGGVIVTLVVVAQVRLPHGGNVLVHVHLLAQRHHHEDACNGEREREREGQVFMLKIIPVFL